MTHGRIVGGGSEQVGRLAYHCKDFVKWANEEANVEAVFVGHTHENHMFYDVDTDNIDDPPDYNNPRDPNYVPPTYTITLFYSGKTYYIESEKST